MNEQDYIEQIWSLWPTGEGERVLDPILELSEAAVAQFPASAELWQMRGDLLLLDEKFHGAMEAYLLANSLSPHDGEILESMGFLYDAVFEQPADAEECFRKALAIEATPNAYAGLARLLTETGRKDEGLALIAETSCPHSSHPDVAAVRREIEEGLWD